MPWKFHSFKFVMLLCLQFAMVEVVNTTLMDAKEKLGLTFFKRKELVALIVCFVAFLIGIPNLMQV